MQASNSTHITLIGMPGCGKTYIGKLLAKKLGWNFVDTDHLIEKKFQTKLPHFIKQVGETEFKKNETEIILGLKLERQTIISTGGSVVYSEESMRHLKSLSKIIFLDAPLKTLIERVNREPRGIVGMGNESFENLYQRRLPLYMQYSDFIIKSEDEKSAENLIQEICNCMLLF